MSAREIKISKFLSLVLRHQPETIGLELNEAGWAPVDLLLEASRKRGMGFTVDELRSVVRNSDKKRFSFSEDGLLIRANQGHSVSVDLGYDPAEPPEVLYHGTAERFLSSIERQGLIKGARHHVHLSSEIGAATKVGRRHGRPVVIRVRAGQMRRDGFVFYLTANQVWLTQHAPTEYLVF
jgi:putative RNA 2'-phosphotransferase